MANLLNAASIMMCPHGGTVSVITRNTKVMLAGSLLLSASDTFTVAGCALAGLPTPSPCMQVQWVTPNVRSQALGDFTLSETSVGLCVATNGAVQGTVLVNFTQTQGSGI